MLGRKNWLFNDSVRNIKANANLYSLIETAKANTIKAIEALLPDTPDLNHIAAR